MKRIKGFHFFNGQLINDKYLILGKLGEGHEGEVYLVSEVKTKIQRAAKFFYPHRNLRNLAANLYAKKMHKLRNCSISTRYVTQEVIVYQNIPVTFLISELVEGVTLNQFLQETKRSRLTCFEAVHLLHALASGIQEMHDLKQYHGDLHGGNIVVESFGLNFKVKILDSYHWGDDYRLNIKEDIVHLIHLFYQCLGGEAHYSHHPQVIKDICMGRKRQLILKKFKSASAIKTYLEHLVWN